MSPTKHTPGPWMLDLCDEGAFAVYVPPLVDMGWSTVITSRNQLPDRAAESHANARLIAAAPDLFEALKAIIENDGGEGSKCYHAIKLFDAREKAHAAIAKATGVQHEPHH